MSSREWIALVALILGPNGLVLFVLLRVLALIRKWDMVYWQHSLMWQDYAASHDIPPSIVRGEQ